MVGDLGNVRPYLLCHDGMETNVVKAADILGFASGLIWGEVQGIGKWLIGRFESKELQHVEAEEAFKSAV